MGDPSDGEAPKAWHSRVRGKPSKVSSRRRNEFHGSRSKGVHTKSVREVRGGLSADEDDDDAEKEPIPDEAAALVSSTNTITTETFSEEELYLRQKCKRPSLLKGKQWTSVSSKIHSLKQRTPLHGTTAQFVFQRPRTRIDWRSLHAVDVEQIFRETDIHKLESILETVAFGDVLGEDTRNFTEQNFLKLFRLSQLMIEYLLHVQETLASDKQKLLVARESLQKRGEKLQVQCLWQYDALKRTRRELKHAKKTLNTYEMVLRTNGKVSSFQQVHHCPFCEKLFESSRFLDQHIIRRHPKSMNQITEDKILEIVSKAEEATAARVKSETTLMLQAELQHLRAASQVDSQKDEADLHLEVESMQDALKESNDKLQDIQCQLESLQSHIRDSKMTGRSHHGKERMEQKKSKQHRRNLEMKFNDVELHLKKINHDNSRLKKELEQTNCELTGMKLDKRKVLLSLENQDQQMEELLKQNQRLKKSLKELPKERDEAISEDAIGTEADTVDPADNKRTKQMQCLEYESKEEERDVAASALAHIEVEMSFSDKEKWIKDRPYTAIPNLPYALSKYPHRQSVYTNMHEKISQNLADELEKFGISPDAEGISDDKFAAATAALEKQRTARFSSAPASERTIMEYERSTILWHIERAVHTRDMDMIESIFDGETDSGSEASNGQINLSDIDLNNEEGRQLAVTIDEKTSSRRKGSRQENRNSCVEPESGSEGSDVDQRTKEHRKSGLAEAQLQYASKEFFWKTDEEPETQTFRVTGQVLAQRIKSPIADQHHFILSPVESPKGMDKNEDEQAEDSLGLGEWESEDGKNIISPKSMSLLYTMRRGVFIDHDGIASPRSSNEQAPQTSKLTGRLRVEGVSKANRADRESKHQKETESAISPTYPTKVQL